MSKVSDLDQEHLKIIRHSVSTFVATSAKKYDQPSSLLLDVAPQDHEGAAPYFKLATIETLDINPESKATYIADLCAKNDQIIPSDHFDFVVCTEVLEHTQQPFDAVDEIERILKSDGLVFISAPFNFRIHGPLPDCWRFTEHGLRALFKNFEIVELNITESEDRFLMPIHHTLVARKK